MRSHKGKDKEKLQDFEQLEGALRRFVLEKRARSKLAPARTYLLNILTDLNVLATFNQDIAQSELDRVSAELDELEGARPEHNRDGEEKCIIRRKAPGHAYHERAYADPVDRTGDR